MKFRVINAVLLFVLTGQSAIAAVALDRTRIVFNGDQKSVSLSISNENKQMPYLAQGWIEDIQGNKISSPLVVLPPVQRVEPGAKSQILIQKLPAISTLLQDRESVFYFNLREIPPRSDKPNTLQIALQTRIKLFYRPPAILSGVSDTPWQEKITLSRQGDSYVVNNPTAFYVTLVDASTSAKGISVSSFKPVMVAPKGSETLPGSAGAYGASPVLTYINDYGGRPKLQFSCSGNSCKATPIKS